MITFSDGGSVLGKVEETKSFVTHRNIQLMSTFLIVVTVVRCNPPGLAGQIDRWCTKFHTEGTHTHKLEYLLLYFAMNQFLYVRAC